jgi:pimeloyl-ACP methyl ester carboxylesterase
MRLGWRIAAGLLVATLIGLVAYTGYIGLEGSRRLVERDGTSRDCRTPDVQYGWQYEAINYDIADDAELLARNDDLTECDYEGTRAGDEIVTSDGVGIAGWYVPAANGADPSAPTVVVVHGFKSNKSTVLRYGVGLHQDFNLVFYDSRNTGRSGGTQTTGGVLEQNDLRAVIDWLERTKQPQRVGVLGNSLGAATALAEVRTDPRVQAVILDSMHTRIRYQIEARVDAEYVSYFGTTWAILAGINLRTGVDLTSIDAEDIIADYGRRPLLVTHGTADTEDLPQRTESFVAPAPSHGIPGQLAWCPNSGHNAPAGMPVDVCADGFADWTRSFFASALQ